MTTRRLKKYTQLQVECKELVAEGVGLCHIDSSLDVTPLTGFITGILPGETGVVNLTRVKSSHFEGSLLRKHQLPEQWQGQTEIEFAKDTEWAIYKINTSRVKEPCDNFVSCGGCKLLHLSYEDTLSYKKIWLTTHLQRNHVDFPEIEVIAAPKQYYYRNHVQVHINKHKERGFYAPNTYRTVGFPDSGGCLLFNQKTFDDHFPREIELERCVRFRFDEETEKYGHWSLYGKEDKSASFSYTIPLLNSEPVQITIPNTAFFQVNTSFIPIWLEKIAQLIQESNASNLNNATTSLKVLELFSGFGFISTLLSVEMNINALGLDILPPNALKDITFMAKNEDLHKRLQQQHSQFSKQYLQADLTYLEKKAEKIKKRLNNFEADLLLMNPARSGFQPKQIDLLFDTILSGFNKPVIYSSCNAATFTRDAAHFQGKGYKLQSLSLLDFFPFTSHSEVVGLFNRIKY